MPQYSSIVRSLNAEKFSEILSTSGRKAREVYFHRHSIRSPKTSGIPKAGAKNEFRTNALFAALQKRDDEELSEEMLRTWLLTKRELLSAALDHLKIEHKDGLTDSDDVSRIEKLTGKELQDLAGALKKIAPEDEIAIYLKFMGAQGVDEALKAAA